MIRVVMVTPNFSLVEGGVNGGTQGVSLYLCRALANIQDVDLHVICPLDSNHTQGFRNIHGLNVHVLGKCIGIPGLFDEFDRMKTISLVNKLSPHVVHFQTLPSWANKCPIPSVVTIHGIRELDVLYSNSFAISRIKFLILSFQESRARKKVKNVIANSSYVHSFLSRKGTQQVWNIPNPVAEDFFNIQRAPVSGRIFSASHMTHIKNVRSLIEAFAVVANTYPQAELRLAGSHQESFYGHQCRLLVDNLGLSDRVKFLGLLPVVELKEELSRAACFALCSYQENAPLSISEAMAAGVPIVASRVGGIPWMLNEGQSGILINSKNVHDISHGLLVALSNPRNESLGIQAKKRAEQLFKPDVVANQTLNVYLEIISNAKASIE